MNDVYRKVNFGLFTKPLLEISKNGFYYDGKAYSLLDVKEVRVAGGHSSPKLLGVDLSDGKKIMETLFYIVCFYFGKLKA